MPMPETPSRDLTRWERVKMRAYRVMTPGAMIGFVGAFVALYFAFSIPAGENHRLISRLRADEAKLTGQVAALKVEEHVRCSQELDSRAVLRRVLTFAETFSLASTHLTAEQRTLTIQFYGGALRLVPPIVCTAG